MPIFFPAFRFVAIPMGMILTCGFQAFGADVDTTQVHSESKGSYRWELLDNQRLPAPEVVCMVSDDQGNKYLGTKGGMTWISRFDDYQKYTRASTNGGLPSDSINAMAIGENREVWVATDKGLARFANGNWRVLTMESTQGGIPDNAITSLAVTRNEIWVGTHQGFAQFRGGAWTTYAGEKISGRLPYKAVTAIALDSSGNRWIGTIAGLVRFTGASWTVYSRESTQGGLPHSSITYLTVSPHGTLWIGTQSGLAAFSKNTFTAYTNADWMGELAGEQVYDLAVDPSGLLWIASKGGAGSWDGKTWSLFTRNTTTGIRTRWVYSILSTTEGETWFGTQKGVSRRIPVPPDDLEN